MARGALAREGVIKFAARHREAEVPAALVAPVLDELFGWREVLCQIGLLGQVEGRYEGAAYGNLSARLAEVPRPSWQRPFVITGTQTSGKLALSQRDVCVVSRSDPEANWVESEGRVLPSSESMTHAAVYAARHSVRWVFHVHSTCLWRAARELGVPSTPADVEYGTSSMARAVKQLVGASPRDAGLLAMAGHEDGVVAFGPTAASCGAALIAAHARAAGRATLR